VQKGNGIR